MMLFEGLIVVSSKAELYHRWFPRTFDHGRRVCFAKTLAERKIKNIAANPLPALCYNSNHVLPALARIQVARPSLP